MTGSRYVTFHLLGLLLLNCPSWVASAEKDKDMTVLRTPDERFVDLPGFSFAPHYLTLSDPDFGDLRMHYLDEGPADAPVLVCLHGQGTWTYMYRKMIPPLLDAGFRVISPDYIGFGRSDKLPADEDYTFEKHIFWMTQFFRQMELEGVDAYMFDWGGFFGLRMAAEHPEFFDRIVLSNTQLPTGRAGGAEWFINWREGIFALPEFPQGEMVNDGVRTKLEPEIIAAYDAPYPDETFKTGPRRFPYILPITPEMPSSEQNLDAWNQLAQWNQPVLTLFSADFEGSSMGPAAIRSHIPGAQNQPHQLIPDAGFYIVEDAWETLAGHIVNFVAKP